MFVDEVAGKRVLVATEDDFPINAAEALEFAKKYQAEQSKQGDGGSTDYVINFSDRSFGNAPDPQSFFREAFSQHIEFLNQRFEGRKKTGQ